MRLLFSLFLLIVTTSCGGRHPSAQLDSKKDLYTTTSEDEEMNSAVINARKTFANFLSAHSSGDTTLKAFAVKLKYAIQDGSAKNEHIWISDIWSNKDSLFGNIASYPEFTKEVAFGDRVYIDTSRISDWCYIDNGNLVGGYTIRVIYSHCNDSERHQMETEMGCKIVP